jgi:hypothetical protein
MFWLRRKTLPGHGGTLAGTEGRTLLDREGPRRLVRTLATLGLSRCAGVEAARTT